MMSAERPTIVDRPRTLLLLGALAFAIVCQFALALTLGPLSGEERARWSVTLFVCIGLSVSTATVLFAVYRLRAHAIGKGVLLAIMAAGLLMRLPYFGAGPMIEDDHFRYRLDGAITAHGLNPYKVAPKTFSEGTAPPAYAAVGAEGLSTIAGINFPELRTIYPGVAQLHFAVAYIIKPWSLDGLRAVILFCEIATALLGLRLLILLGLQHQWLALLWCNPLAAFSLTGQVHIDAALGPFLLIAVLAAMRTRGMLAGAAIGAAIGVKLWPVMLVPILLRALDPRRWTQIAFLTAVGAVALIACAPLLIASVTENSGLTAYAGGWQMNNMPYEWVSYAAYQLTDGPKLEPYLRAAAVLICAGLAVGLARTPVIDGRDLIRRLALVAAAVFYLSPAQFPWYASWFLPFAALTRNWALLVATAALPSYFLFFPLAGTANGDLFPFWLSGLHLLPVIAVLLAQRPWRILPR